jgi:hypothetical protein
MKSRKKINEKKVLKNKTPTKPSKIVKTREQNQADNHYLIGCPRNVTNLSFFYRIKDIETMRNFFLIRIKSKIMIIDSRSKNYRDDAYFFLIRTKSKIMIIDSRSKNIKKQ